MSEEKGHVVALMSHDLKLCVQW